MPAAEALDDPAQWQNFGPFGTFTDDAGGNTLADTRAGALGLTFAHDENGRLSQTFQTNNPLEGATYAYDARWRLASRTLKHATAPATEAISYVHDIAGHVIAEYQAGKPTLEYIWLGDLPVALVRTPPSAAPVLYNHPHRPPRPPRRDGGRERGDRVRRGMVALRHPLRQLRQRRHRPPLPRAVADGRDGASKMRHGIDKSDLQGVDSSYRCPIR